MWEKRGEERGGERGACCRYTRPGKALFHPGPKHPLDTTTLTPCQKDLVFTCCQLLQKDQLMQKVICASCLTEFPIFLPVFTVPYPFSLLPPGHKLSKNQPLTSIWSPNKQKALQGELETAITNYTSGLTYFPRCKSRKRHLITSIKILPYTQILSTMFLFVFEHLLLCGKLWGASWDRLALNQQISLFSW